MRNRNSLRRGRRFHLSSAFAPPNPSFPYHPHLCFCAASDLFLRSGSFAPAQRLFCSCALVVLLPRTGLFVPVHRPAPELPAGATVLPDAPEGTAPAYGQDPHPAPYGSRLQLCGFTLVQCADSFFTHSPVPDSCMARIRSFRTLRSAFAYSRQVLFLSRGGLPGPVRVFLDPESARGCCPAAEAGGGRRLKHVLLSC